MLWCLRLGNYEGELSAHRNPGITLASASPRRRELLRTLGLQYDVVPAAIDETAIPCVDPLRGVTELARRKAYAVLRSCPDRLVVAADTIVVLGSSVFGKPDDPGHAERMLHALRGRWHRVLTGLAVAGDLGRPPVVTCVTTQVRMRRYNLREVRRYVAGGDPLDKAAAYAIQHEDFSPVAEIRGCRANVMGLPVCVLAHCLRQLGCACGDPREACAQQLGITCAVELSRPFAGAHARTRSLR